MFDQGNLTLQEHISVWYFLPPADTKDGLKTTNIENLKEPWCDVGKGSMLRSRTATSRHRQPCRQPPWWDGKITIEEDSMQQSAVGWRSSLNTMFNFTVQSAIITQYAPKYVNSRAWTSRSPWTVKGDAEESWFVARDRTSVFIVLTVSPTRL